MKHLFALYFAIVVAVSASAQFGYDVEFTKNDFNNAGTIISKTGDCSWGKVLLLDGITFGNALTVLTDKQNECVIALEPGLPDKIYFKYHVAIGGTINVYESTDHTNWTNIWGKEVKVDVSSNDSARLSNATRYIKLEFTGKSTMMLSNIKVTELKDLSVSATEVYFPHAMVDDEIATQIVTAHWTNVVANVACADSAFTVSPASFGQKGIADKTTPLVITFDHSVAGEHNSDIVIEGSGKKAVIHVEGTVSKYDQQLIWTDQAGEYSVTDNILLRASTNHQQPIAYISSDSTIAYVDNRGALIPLCAGTVQITATQSGNYKFNAAEPITKEFTFTKADPTVAISADNLVYGQKVSESKLTETTGKQAGTMQWVDISPDSVPDAGTYTWQVLFTPEDECKYNAVTRMVSLYIDKAQQAVVWEQAVSEVKVNENIPIDAYATSGLPLTHAMTNCNIAIEENSILGLDEGEVMVVAFQQGDKNFYPTSVAVHVFTVLPNEKPTPTDNVEKAMRVQENPNKYINNGHMYIKNRQHIYNAEGKTIR